MIGFELNGEMVSVDCEPTDRLLDVLREVFGLTGPKEGCGEGECGACSVIIDGKLLNSCITPMGSVRGKSVLTIEGLRKTKRFEILDSCFADAGAVQCGFCTPGMMLAAEALLTKTPEPDEAAVRTAISGNLCRCTGYSMIVEAILAASVKGSGLW